MNWLNLPRTNAQQAPSTDAMQASRSVPVQAAERMAQSRMIHPTQARKTKPKTLSRPCHQVGTRLSLIQPIIPARLGGGGLSGASLVLTQPAS
jgi:hypothetical protein